MGYFYRVRGVSIGIYCRSHSIFHSTERTYGRDAARVLPEGGSLSLREGSGSKGRLGRGLY